MDTDFTGKSEMLETDVTNHFVALTMDETEITGKSLLLNTEVISSSEEKRVTNQSQLSEASVTADLSSKVENVITNLQSMESGVISDSLSMHTGSTSDDKHRTDSTLFAAIKSDITAKLSEDKEESTWQILEKEENISARKISESCSVAQEVLDEGASLLPLQSQTSNNQTVEMLTAKEHPFEGSDAASINSISGHSLKAGGFSTILDMEVSSRKDIIIPSHEVSSLDDSYEILEQTGGDEVTSEPSVSSVSDSLLIQLQTRKSDDPSSMVTLNSMEAMSRVVGHDTEVASVHEQSESSLEEVSSRTTSVVEKESADESDKGTVLGAAAMTRTETNVGVQEGKLNQSEALNQGDAKVDLRLAAYAENAKDSMGTIAANSGSNLSRIEQTDSSFASDTEFGVGFKTEIDYTHKSKDISILESSIVNVSIESIKSHQSEQDDEDPGGDGLSLKVVAPAKGIPADETDVVTAETTTVIKSLATVEEEDDDDEGDDDDDDDDEDDEDNQAEFSKILTLAKKMDSKGAGNDDEWLSRLAKKISKPGEGESSSTQDVTIKTQSTTVEEHGKWEAEQGRDVFGDKDWDICQELEDDADSKLKFTTLTEFDLSSEASSDISKTKYAAAEYDMSSEAATSDTASSKEEKRGYDEYDIISHSSSAISLSEDSSTKESSPIKEMKRAANESIITTSTINEAVDKLEALSTTPTIVRRMFTSSSQRLNDSMSQVNVTLDSAPALKKKLSESTTSIDSNTSTSTITKETVIPTVMVSGEESEGSAQEMRFSSTSFSTENLSTRQEITQVTQSRVLYRGKSPSQSRLSESSDSSEDLMVVKTLKTSEVPMASSTPAKEAVGAAKDAAKGAAEVSESAADGSASASVLDSQTEFADVHETSTAPSDSETSSTTDQEEVWVTETSEMVTSFVTETVRKTKVDEFGNESVEETIRVLGPDGREVNPDIANSLMRSPSFHRKN